jgi:hypothetical protein
MTRLLQMMFLHDLTSFSYGQTQCRWGLKSDIVWRCGMQGKVAWLMLEVISSVDCGAVIQNRYRYPESVVATFVVSQPTPLLLTLHCKKMQKKKLDSRGIELIGC